MYLCFRIRPWHKNVARSLLKEPKVYLWDWSNINDKGAKTENMVASHLLKAVHFWTDTGLGEFDLFFLRDKDKHEVDFLITKERKPWILLEVKSSSNDRLSPSIEHFQKQLNAPHAFQVAFDLDFMEIDFRKLKQPQIIPSLSFLSQLL